MGKFLIFIIFVAIVILLPLSLLGQVPLLSSAIGAAPKDLGISINKADSDVSQSKVGTQVVTLSPTTPLYEDYRLEGKKPADISFDSKEATALVNNRAWANYPFKSVQIRINSDGSIETSGIITVKKAMPYAVALGYSESDIKKAMDKYHLPSLEIPFYLKGTGSIINNQVALDVSQAKIGAIPLPSSIVATAQNEAENLIEDIIYRHRDNFNCESLQVENNQIRFKGSVPEKEYVIGS